MESCYGQALQGVQTAHTSRRRFSPICLETVILSPCSGSSLQATSYVHLTSATKPLVIYFFPSFFFQSGHWPQFVKIRRNNSFIGHSNGYVGYRKCHRTVRGSKMMRFEFGRTFPFSSFRRQTEESSVSTLVCV